MGCNSSSEGTQPSAGGKAAKGKGVFQEKVEWAYFGLNGRGDPLKQIFEYHGQQHNKKSWEAEAWEAEKAAGNGGEFGGGLPYALVTVNGKQHRLSQMGAILRMFCIKFGYYNTKDWKMARYADPIVDTFADVLAKSSAILFGPEDQKEANIAAFIAIAKLYH